MNWRWIMRAFQSRRRATSPISIFGFAPSMRHAAITARSLAVARSSANRTQLSSSANRVDRLSDSRSRRCSCVAPAATSLSSMLPLTRRSAGQPRMARQAPGRSRMPVIDQPVAQFHPARDCVGTGNARRLIVVCHDVGAAIREDRIGSACRRTGAQAAPRCRRRRRANHRLAGIPDRTACRSNLRRTGNDRRGSCRCTVERRALCAPSARHWHGDQLRFNQRAAASAVSSGRVLNAIAALGAALWIALITFSNSSRVFGGSLRPAPMTTQS